VHNSWIGSAIHKRLVAFVANQTVCPLSSAGLRANFKNSQNATYSTPGDSPLRLTHSFYWSVRAGTDGLKREDSFPSLVLKGQIKPIAPAHVVGYAASIDESPGGTVHLNNGEDIAASAVVVSTGYSCCWGSIMDGMFSSLSSAFI